MSDLGQKIIAETRKVAAANPHFIYRPRNGCQYVRDGAPSCLIGHALWSLNLIDADCDFDAMDISGIDRVVDTMDWSLEIGEIDWLATVQDAQDRGEPWGKSVAVADEIAP